MKFVDSGKNHVYRQEKLHGQNGKCQLLHRIYYL
jgi:hypothetical protein